MSVHSACCLQFVSLRPKEPSLMSNELRGQLCTVSSPLLSLMAKPFFSILDRVPKWLQKTPACLLESLVRLIALAYCRMILVPRIFRKNVREGFQDCHVTLSASSALSGADLSLPDIARAETPRRRPRIRSRSSAPFIPDVVWVVCSTCSSTEDVVSCIHRGKARISRND